MKTIILSQLPPPLSQCFTNRHVKPKGTKKGFVARTPTKRYTDWRTLAQGEVMSQCTPTKPIDDPVTVTYHLVKPSKRKMDIMNREKGLSDLLVDTYILSDDSLIHEIRMRWVESDHPVKITIEKFQ